MNIADITVEKVLSLETAFEGIRNATLEAAGGEEIFFYRAASLRLAEVDPNELNPTSLYVLRKNLEFQRDLRKHLLQACGIDTLRLDCVLHLRDGDKLIGMIPPYVEVSEERVVIVPKDGDLWPPQPGQILRLPLLIDGIHRVWLAREEGLKVRCVVTSGTNRNYLHCAYPNSWSEVAVYDEVPQRKKYYRRHEHYSFMRPLDRLRLLEAKQEKEYGR